MEVCSKNITQSAWLKFLLIKKSWCSVSLTFHRLSLYESRSNPDSDERAGGHHKALNRDVSHNFWHGLVKIITNNKTLMWHTLGSVLSEWRPGQSEYRQTVCKKEKGRRAPPREEGGVQFYNKTANAEKEFYKVGMKGKEVSETKNAKHALLWKELSTKLFQLKGHIPLPLDLAL